MKEQGKGVFFSRQQNYMYASFLSHLDGLIVMLISLSLLMCYMFLNLPIF